MRKVRFLSALLAFSCLTVTGCSQEPTANSLLAEKYVVSFDSKGGSSVPVQQVNIGSLVTKPSNPTKDGYTFVGWYDENDRVWNFDVDVIIKSTTLYAKWEQNPASGPSEPSQSQEENSSTNPTNPTTPTNTTEPAQPSEPSTPTTPTQEPDPEAEYEIRPEISGGTKEERLAILQALNNFTICEKRGVTNTNIYPTGGIVLREDNGDSIVVRLAIWDPSFQTDSSVSLFWEFDNTQEYFGKFVSHDYLPEHQWVEINYKGYGVSDGTLTWTLKELRCGSAVADNANITYTATIKNSEYYRVNMTIAECYAFDDDIRASLDSTGEHLFPSTFNIVDYDNTLNGTLYPYFNPYYNVPYGVEQKYIYANITGQCIYISPDGSFMLLADGEEILEVYAGAGMTFNYFNYPALDVGKVVEVRGTMSQYCGHIQLSFVTAILKGDPSLINEPSLGFRNLTQEDILSLTKDGFTSHTQALKVGGVDMMSSLRSVTGTLFAGSTYLCNGSMDMPESWTCVSPEQFSSSRRFKFTLQVGSTLFTILYDYHVDRTKDYDKVVDQLKYALMYGQQITIRGFAKYLGSDDNPFYQEGHGGEWTICPFEKSHISYTR